MDRIWRHNQDRDLAGYLNLIVTPTIAKQKVELSTGGLFRHKNRDNYYNTYILRTQDSVSALFTGIGNVQSKFKTTDGGKGDLNNSNNYSSTEDVSAGYVQAKFDVLQHLQIIGGVRVEHTNQHYETAAPITLNGRYGHIWYTDVLPSINLKYSLGTKQNIRSAYYKAISRPGFYEITPYSNAVEFYLEQGNPYLKHTTSDNFDLRYELFPGGADQVLIGGFYKRVYNPIELALERRGTGTQVLTPENFGTANNYGLEAVVTKYFGKFGITANYTYTKSKITTTKGYYYRNTTTGDLETKYINQTRPMQGQANHVGNIALLYKNGRLGLDVQAAFVYTGERLTQVSPYYGLDYWQRPYNQLDFSLEKTIVKHFSFYTKLNNLTNSVSKVIVKQPNLLQGGNNRLPLQDNADYIFVQRDIYKLSALFGFRYKF